MNRFVQRSSTHGDADLHGRADEPDGVPTEAPPDLLGKLGIKSWRDDGSLRPIFQGMPLEPIVRRLLSQPTAPQRIVARAWLDSGTPLKLHLSAYRDVSHRSCAC